MTKSHTLFRDTLSEAEKDFRRMCDNSPICIWMSNTSGTGFFFNKAWRSYTGEDVAERFGEWYENIHPDERNMVSARHNKHFAARAPYRVEYRLRRHDGVYRWIISHASPYYDSKNHFAGFISACIDFNDQHEFENTLAMRALKQTALAAYGRLALEVRKFGELTHEAVNVILETLHVDCAYLTSLNHDTHELTLEAFACRLGQNPPSELGHVKPVALSITRAMQMADDRENFPLAQLLASKGIQSSLICPVGSGGQLYGYFFANTRSVRTFSSDAIDFIQGLSNVLAAVHQREHAEKALAESEQKLLQAQKVEAVGLLAGGIAHDFNNLLTAICGYTELLQKDITRLSLNEDATRTLRAHTAGIENAALRASKLVRQLLTFSRTQSTQIARIDINALILDFKDLITAFLRSGIHLELKLGPEPVYAYVDRNQIEQVILNLAINSRDAMSKGGSLTISVASAEVAASSEANGLEPGRYAQISIADTGSGIPPEIQDKIFTPFFTTKPKSRGTGLGLVTCVNIVKTAHGKISFETAQGKGTTFTLLLPDIAPARTVAPADASVSPFFLEHDSNPPIPAPQPKQDAPADESDLPTGDETIILVEDDAAIREVTAAILESLGYTVRAYGTGEALLTQYRVDVNTVLADAKLLITDINMPGISGRQLADRMRTMHPGEMRVLFISGFVTASLQKSTAHFLEKPFTRDILARKVREVLDE
ncbi:ATP-binding protein [Ereboglobus luteus]|uniref:histidine kinase n=1 Tax=Ereboglobus luteus TaxID=1796921 RepID=A0A2U8E1Y6_9BACT|nr:ATP-binding protein [Ereboglobus luteus]AWI08820.1 hypothetical protein CKA38_05730 [Ereboglobus luteus]